MIPKGPPEMKASKLQVDSSHFFKRLNLDADRVSIESVAHGCPFEETFHEDQVTQTHGMVLKSVLFDN